MPVENVSEGAVRYTTRIMQELYEFNSKGLRNVGKMTPVSSSAYLPVGKVPCLPTAVSGTFIVRRSRFRRGESSIHHVTFRRFHLS